MRGEKQDLSALPGQSVAMVILPSCGEFKMQLSEYDNSNPLDLEGINA